MKETRAEYLAVDKLRPFDEHPFKVVDNEEMDQLVWSILTTKIVVTQDFSPALDSSTTGSHQGLILNNKIATHPGGDFSFQSPF